MRVDASNLLDRLGRHDFSYKEFEDRFTELELWPLLEALLRDPRLQELDTASALPGVLPTPGTPSESFSQTEPASPQEPIGSLFRRYESAPDAAQDNPAPSASGGQDVRAMLRHLSDLGARGEI